MCRRPSAGPVALHRATAYAISDHLIHADPLHLLKTTDYNVERIASMVGYADGVTLRTLLRRRLGRGVRELRALA